MNNYEAKIEAKRERYAERAERTEAEARRLFRKADLREEVSGIPLGQPVLVGHHSERRHRNAIDRAHKALGKAIETDKKAAHYAEKAESYGTHGISSDDPEAPDKLADKLAKLEARQDYMRNANKAVRAAYKHGVRETGSAEDIAILVRALHKATGRDHTESEARAILKPDFANRRGFADYELTNNNANIRRIKQRINQLEQNAKREHKETEHDDGIKVVENVEANRLQIFFPGKPPAETRASLKSYGFRWAPSEGAWQRHLSNGARYAAECVLKVI